MKINIDQLKLEYIIIIAFIVMFILRTGQSIYNKKFKMSSFVTGLIMILSSIPIVILLKPVLLYICIIVAIFMLVK